MEVKLLTAICCTVISNWDCWSSQFVKRAEWCQFNSFRAPILALEFRIQTDYFPIIIYFSLDSVLILKRLVLWLKISVELFWNLLLNALICRLVSAEVLFQVDCYYLFSAFDKMCQIVYLGKYPASDSTFRLFSVSFNCLGPSIFREIFGRSNAMNYNALRLEFVFFLRSLIGDVIPRISIVFLVFFRSFFPLIFCPN